MSDRAQLSEIAQRVRDGRLRTNIGTVAALDDAVAAFNPTERIKGKTIIRVHCLTPTKVQFTRGRRVQMSNTITPTVFYRTLNVEGLEIFYREAGPRDAPTVLLLHGFPSSSHMFRNLIPMLADKYHVIAPDFPGYGESSAPPVNDFDYSFEGLTAVTEKFTEKLNLSSYALFLSDIGASVGFRLAVMHPERVTAMIVKNGGIFTVQGAELFKRDIPSAELYLFDTGHFALEEEGNRIGSLMREFLDRAINKKWEPV